MFLCKRGMLHDENLGCKYNRDSPGFKD